MILNVKTLSGEIIVIHDVHLTTTILELKQKVMHQKKVAVHRQRLICAGRLLDNNRTVEDYQLQHYPGVHFVLDHPDDMQ